MAGKRREKTVVAEREKNTDEIREEQPEVIHDNNDSHSEKTPNEKETEIDPKEPVVFVDYNVETKISTYMPVGESVMLGVLSGQKLTIRLEYMTMEFGDGKSQIIKGFPYYNIADSPSEFSEPIDFSLGEIWCGEQIVYKAPTSSFPEDSDRIAFREGKELKEIIDYITASVHESTQDLRTFAIMQKNGGFTLVTVMDLVQSPPYREELFPWLKIQTGSLSAVPELGKMCDWLAKSLNLSHERVSGLFRTKSDGKVSQFIQILLQSCLRAVIQSANSESGFSDDCRFPVETDPKSINLKNVFNIPEDDLILKYIERS